MDTVLMNRLDGDAVGPVKVLVSNPVYSHDHSMFSSRRERSCWVRRGRSARTGFGQQRRMAVAFHRMIMPDGYSVDLDQFHGLDQIGEEGLKDKVNNHYLADLRDIDCSRSHRRSRRRLPKAVDHHDQRLPGVHQRSRVGVSQSATTVLDRFIQIPPTITIREGHRVKVYFTQDMLLPAYENHTIPQTF